MPNYTQGFYDLNVIPDPYNTGAKGTLTPVNEVEYLMSENIAQGSTWYVTKSITNINNGIFENIDFGNVCVFINKSDTPDIIEFINCNFEGDGSLTYAIQQGFTNYSLGKKVICRNCTFQKFNSSAINSAPNMELYNCYIRGNGGDGIKGCCSIIKNCYIADNGYAENAHADGIQISGITNYVENISIENCRFENLEIVNGNNPHLSNSGIFFSLESLANMGSDGASLKNIYINGGGYSIYLGTKSGEITNLYTENIQIGCSKRYENVYPSKEATQFLSENVYDSNGLYVSSVWKEDDKVKLCVTNYTNQESVLTIITDNNRYTFNISACPTYEQYINVYTDQKEAPFNLVKEIPKCSYLVCYDGDVSIDNQIRYVVFEEKYNTISELFKDICNSVRQKDGSTELIEHQNLPLRIMQINNSAYEEEPRYYDTLNELFIAICNAIRTKTFTTDDILHSDIPQKILSIITQRTVIPQTGTWQLKNTTNKKYVILGTDDDNVGNAWFFRLLRSYGFKYTMNVESENAIIFKNLGNDIDEDTFTEQDAPSLFPNGVNVIELGKYLHNNNLGEVAQHGSSEKTLWDSAKLTGDFLNNLYATYIQAGGTKTQQELANAIKEQLSDTDGSQDASYIAECREQLENVYGFYIDTVGGWGGEPKAIIDGIELSLNQIKGTANYDWRKHEYAVVSSRVGSTYISNINLYDLTRMAIDLTTIPNHLEKVPIGHIVEFFCHSPKTDATVEQWRSTLSYLKDLSDNNKIEVITRREYFDLGEYVSNPIVKIEVSRDNIPIGETDDISAYNVIATYQDGTNANVSKEAIVDNSGVNVNVEGSYVVYATYRGFNTTANVSVVDAKYTLPTELKTTNYWFVFKDNGRNKLFCGNTSGKFGSASVSSNTLAFINCENGYINGWESDDGKTWVQNTINLPNYKTIKTNETTAVSHNYNFGMSAKTSVTWLETSNNFELAYPY